MKVLTKGKLVELRPGYFIEIFLLHEDANLGYLVKLAEFKPEQINILVEAISQLMHTSGPENRRKAYDLCKDLIRYPVVNELPAYIDYYVVTMIDQNGDKYVMNIEDQEDAT